MYTSKHPLERDFLRFVRYNGLKKQKWSSKYILHLPRMISIRFQDCGYIEICSLPTDGYTVQFKCYTLETLFKKMFEYGILKPVPNFKLWKYPPYPKHERINPEIVKYNSEDKSDYAKLRERLKYTALLNRELIAKRKFEKTGQLTIEFTDYGTNQIYN